MLSYSPVVIDVGLRRGRVDVKQAVDIFGLTASAMAEIELFRACMAFCDLHVEETSATLKKQFKVIDF